MINTPVPNIRPGSVLYYLGMLLICITGGGPFFLRK